MASCENFWKNNCNACQTISKEVHICTFSASIAEISSGLIHDSGVPLVCCGEKMSELVPNTTEGATEKHLPAVDKLWECCPGRSA